MVWYGMVWLVECTWRHVGRRMGENKRAGPTRATRVNENVSEVVARNCSIKYSNFIGYVFSVSISVRRCRFGVFSVVGTLWAVWAPPRICLVAWGASRVAFDGPNVVVSVLSVRKNQLIDFTFTFPTTIKHSAKSNSKH